MSMRHIPNALTCSRIAMAAAFPFCGPSTRLLLLAGAMVTEFFDGFTARRFGWVSASGRILDPVADKVLFAFVTLTFLGEGRIGWLELVAVGIRDLTVATGALVLMARRRWREFRGLEPRLLGKATTALQYLAFFGLALGLRWGPTFYAFVFAVGAAAAVQYVWPFARRAIGVNSPAHGPGGETMEQISISRCDWGAILCGAALTLALTASAVLLGNALGLSPLNVLDPMTGEGRAAASWMFNCVALGLAFGCGGLFGARMSGARPRRDAVRHGLASWAVGGIGILWIGLEESMTFAYLLAGQGNAAAHWLMLSVAALGAVAAAAGGLLGAAPPVLQQLEEPFGRPERVGRPTDRAA